MVVSSIVLMIMAVVVVVVVEVSGGGDGDSLQIVSDVGSVWLYFSIFLSLGS